MATTPDEIRIRKKILGSIAPAVLGGNGIITISAKNDWVNDKGSYGLVLRGDFYGLGNDVPFNKDNCLTVDNVMSELSREHAQRAKDAKAKATPVTGRYKSRFTIAAEEAAKTAVTPPWSWGTRPDKDGYLTITVDGVGYAAIEDAIAASKKGKSIP